jgi:hypothetical protein
MPEKKDGNRKDTAGPPACTNRPLRKKPLRKKYFKE